MATIESALDEVRGYSVFALAKRIGAGHPSGTDSYGAQYIESVRETFVADVQIQGAAILDDEDWPWEVAEGSAPPMTHELWSTFVDLAGYQEDLDGFAPSEILEDMDSLPRWVLDGIARRLVGSLQKEVKEARDDDDE